MQRGVKEDLDALTHWYQDPCGQVLKRQITSALTEELAGLAVSEVLHLGAGGFEAALAGRKRERSIFFTDMACEPLLGEDENYLPLKPDTQECVVLLHGLDVTANPHGVLRELSRVTAHDGYLIIVGFNQFGLWGGVRPLLRLFYWRREWVIPWCLRFYRIGRIKDWLSLLGFNMHSIRSVNFRPLTQRSRLLHATRHLDIAGGLLLPRCGNVYMVVAQKRTIPLTPVRFKWKLPSELLNPRIAKPSAGMTRNVCRR